MLREKDKRVILNNLASLNIQDGVEDFFGDERIRGIVSFDVTSDVDFVFYNKACACGEDFLLGGSL